MRYSLAQLARRARSPRRSSIAFRAIRPPRTFAQELARLNVGVSDQWIAGLPRIMAEYERSLAALSMDSAATIETELDALDRLAQSVAIVLTPRMRLWAERVSKWHLAKWNAAVLTATNVDLSTVLTTADTIESIETALRRNVGLVRDVSDTTRGKIADAVFRGLQQRSPAREIAKAIREAADMQRARAIRIAGDQVTKLSSALDRERMTQAGLEEYRWRHSGKLHPREEHKARDGKTFKLGTPSGDEPGEAPYCGCSREPILSLDD